MNIMIIDDEPDICIYLSTVLEDNGHTVSTVDENDSILQMVQEKKPDLILLDIMMPKRSGISIYKELRNQDTLTDTAILLMSGMSMEKDFLPSGFRKLIQDNQVPMPEGFIEKPIQLPKLLERIQHLKK